MAAKQIRISFRAVLILRHARVYEIRRVNAQIVGHELLAAKGNALIMSELASTSPSNRNRSEDEILHDVATKILQGYFVLRIDNGACDDSKNKRSRFFEQLPGIYALAARLNVPSDYLVGLASYESGWFDDHNYALNNLWGLTEAGGNNIHFPGAPGNPQPSTDYFERRVGPYIKNVTTVAAFFDGLQKEGYNSANPDYFNLDPAKGELANRISNIQNWKRKCGVS